MPPRRKPTLLAQGKPRGLGGIKRAWHLRLYAPGEGSTETEARDIFARAEAALDNATEAPAGADVRAARTIRMLGKEYNKDSHERDKHPRTVQGRESRLDAHILPTVGDVTVAEWRVAHSWKVMEKGSQTIFSTRGREDLLGQLAAMRKLAWRLGWLDRSIDPLDGLEIERSTVLREPPPTTSVPGPVPRPASFAPWRMPPTSCVAPTGPTH